MDIIVIVIIFIIIELLKKYYFLLIIDFWSLPFSSTVWLTDIWHLLRVK